MNFIHQYGYTNSSVADYKNNSRTTLPEPREFLDTYLHAKAEELQVIEAPTWIEARAEII